MQSVQKEKKVAIFDIDGTVFRSSLLIEVVNMLIERKVFPAEAQEIFNEEHKLWLDRKGGYEDYIMTVVHAFQKYLKGVHYSDFMDTVDAVLARHNDQVYKYTRDLLKKLKKDGYYLLAISQSPLSILSKFGEHMGFDKVYGRIYETGPESRFTGKVIDEHLIMNKSNIVHRAVEKEGLTLKESIGVGDTEDDISFLDMVENPICFNPNAALYRYARIKKWKVVVERKNVIYDIE